MKNIDLKKLLPHILSIAFFALITLIYFNPILKGKTLKQSDIVSYTGVSKEIEDYRNKNNEEPLWTNSMFGGMPAYQVSTKYYGNMVRYIDKILKLNFPHPVGNVFLYMFGFYILLIILGMDSWLAVAGSLAFAFSSYFFIILEAGHNSKAHAIAYMAPVLGSIVLTMRGKYLLGGILTAVFLTLEISANHLQITYYLAMLIAIYLFSETYKAIKGGKKSHLLKSFGILLAALILAMGSNATNLLTTSSYVKYTTRGKSELTIGKENQSSGLDKDYATAWSYGKGETMSLLIPNYKGGVSGYIGQNKSALEKIDPQYKENIAQMDAYWGDQPFTSGPVYVGALIIALFIAGLFVVEGSFKWVLLVGTLLSIFLAWGRHFMFLTEILLDFFPGYNKFRAVSMVLVVAELTIPLLAILALDKVIKDFKKLEEKTTFPFINKSFSKKNLFLSGFGITGLICLFMYISPGAFNNFFKDNEYNEIYEQISKNNSPEIAQDFLNNLEQAREAIFKGDALRSFIFILLGGGIILFFFNSKFDKRLLVAVFSLLVLVDLWTVDKRYLNNENFTSKKEVKEPFPLTRASQQILEDQSPGYRVLNIAVNTFNDASTSYYHKSVGGYHAAKLERYQELIEYHITPEMQNITSTLKTTPTDSAIRTTFARQPVINMLNTKYIIYNGDAPPLQNRYASGPAWLVSNYKLVANADSEITALNNFNPMRTAIIDERFKQQVENFNYKEDASASIKLTDYKPNHLNYEFYAATAQMAIFSEIYYDDGWNAYIDDNKSPYFRANYVLRAMVIPAGKHTIEFKFEPTAYKTGETISYASSSLILILLLAVFLQETRTKREESES